MSLFDRFRKKRSSSSQDELIPVFVPPLIQLVMSMEERKGAALTEEEVLEIRGGGQCIMLSMSKANALDEERGYRDLDPENVWEHWQEFKSQLPPSE